MVTKLVDVADIRFTQERVYDSFNANDARAGSTVELIDAILRGERAVTDLPLIRVAKKRGVYWCVDNRRCFVYKHCQLGKIPMQVFDWKDNREFELKWRNGRGTRAQTGNGLRVGVVQRTDRPFPRSPVAEPALSDISVYLDKKAQRRHDAAIAALRRRREAGEARSAGRLGEAAGERERAALDGLLRGLPAATGGGEATGAAQTAQAAPRRKRKAARAAREPAAGAASGAGAAAAVASTAARPKRRRSGAGGAARVTVDMEREDSDDEAYAVEITSMS